MEYLLVLHLMAHNPTLYFRPFVFLTSTPDELIAKRKAQIAEWNMYDKERHLYRSCFQNANRDEDIDQHSCSHPKMARQKHKSNLDLIEWKLRRLERSIDILGNKIIRQRKKCLRYAQSVNLVLLLVSRVIGRGFPFISLLNRDSPKRFDKFVRVFWFDYIHRTYEQAAYLLR